MTLPIDMVSDVVCPCASSASGGSKRLRYDPIFRSRSGSSPIFSIHGPAEGMSREEYLTTKFGSPERYRAIAQRVATAAAAEGLTYALDKIARQPNTLDCHRLILWAGENAAAMKQRLMEIYFAEGGDLSNRDVLVEAAASCGLERELVRQRLAGEKDIERIEREANSAKESGIDGVPCFILGGILAVQGAQTPEHLAQAIDRAAEEYAKRPAAE